MSHMPRDPTNEYPVVFQKKSYVKSYDFYSKLFRKSLVEFRQAFRNRFIWEKFKTRMLKTKNTNKPELDIVHSMGPKLS